ncbi:MAG: S41 family peptidase [Clostridia bacterium]|nr:S41 family peptidase [Clostridia bacterium]
MHKLKKVFSVLLVLTFVLTATVSAQEDNHLKEITAKSEAAFFTLVLDTVVDMYQFDVQSEEIFRRTVTNLLNENPDLLDPFFKALFASFDDYSEFYTADEYAELLNSLEGITGGIGVYVEKGPQYVHITGTIPESPAAKAGVQGGDLIVAVDGENMEGRSLDYVTYKLRGKVDTNVLITVLRGEETLEFVLTRAELKNTTVSYGVLAGDVGYLGITNFASSTAQEVRDALAYIDTTGVKKLVIDLRNNGGGYVDTAIAIARMLVPAGTIIQHYTRANELTMDYKSYLTESKYNIATLVNENTASAAEILASALQESGASKLVGQKTFGKAVTQSVFPLYADRACKLTTGEYFTRSGKRINKVGLTPDVKVENRSYKLKDTNVDKLIYQTTYPIGVEQEGIKAYKQRLMYMDYTVGAMDNTYSDDFKNAVYAYQSANGITPTGELDLITQIHITNASDDIKVLVDAQLAAAVELLGSPYNGLMAK